MTFAVVMSTPSTTWACADRQLLYPFGPLRDPTAVKISILQAEDGQALLTYAGLGELNNTEVSRWVTQTLSGVNANLNAMMGKIACAAKRNIPTTWQHRFIAAGAGRQHNQGKRVVYRLSKPGKVGTFYAPLATRQIYLEASRLGAERTVFPLIAWLSMPPTTIRRQGTGRLTIEEGLPICLTSFRI
jgi:hypothetical protein